MVSARAIKHTRELTAIATRWACESVRRTRCVSCGFSSGSTGRWSATPSAPEVKWRELRLPRLSIGGGSAATSAPPPASEPLSARAGGRATADGAGRARAPAPPPGAHLRCLL